MLKKLLFILILFLCNVSYVFASECDNSTLLKYRNAANLIKFDIKYIGNLSEDEYGVYISGMSDDFVIAFNDDFYFTDGLVTNLEPKKTYKISVILDSDIVCRSRFSYIRYITMPAYNKYYNNDICKDNIDISYCSLTYDSSKLTEDDFVSKVEEYLELQNVVVEVPDEGINWFLFVGIFGIILIGIVITLVILRKRKKNTF